MKLHFKKSGKGQPIIILHGLFGMLDNWQSIANKLSDDFEVWLVDQRNHGHSPHSDEHSYDLMADDLKTLIDDHSISNPVVVGHSMGGKTVMRFAQKYPDLAAGIVIVDMGMKQYPIHHDTIVEALKSVPVDEITSRPEAEDYLKKHISEAGIRLFLLKNLNRKKDGGYNWRFNLPVLEKEMTKIVAGLPEDHSEVEALFIYGTHSNYIRNEDMPQLKDVFPNARFESLEAGHWLHAEKPAEVFELISSFATIA